MTAVSMENRTGGSSFWPLLITGIAVIVFGSAGFARMMGWGPGTTSYSRAILALDEPAGEAHAGPRCPECGMVVSVREIGWHDEESSGNYESIVRMADGSSRVIDSSGPVRWRMGERLLIIDGAVPLRP